MAAFVSSSPTGLFCPFNGLKVVMDPIKGRCLECLVPVQAGELLFTEEALVYASFTEKEYNDMDIDNENENDIEDNTSSHVNGNLLFRAFGEKVMNELDDIHNELSHLDKVECLDTARNFMQLVAITQLANELSTNNSEQQWDQQIHLLSLLKPGINIEDLYEAIRKFKSSYPRVFPLSISDEVLMTCLGVLNTNQVELEDYGGSGLFVGTAIIEHSCHFNCSYTTKGSTLYMSATKSIAVGERLSIDYGNNFYSPTSARKVSLFDIYGFLCSCSMCIGENAIDRKRAFWCPNCRSNGVAGVVCPIGPFAHDLINTIDNNNSVIKSTSAKSKTNTNKKSKPKIAKVSTYNSNVILTAEECTRVNIELLADCLETEKMKFCGCSVCGVVPDVKYTKECLRGEEYLRQNPPETFDEVITIGSGSDPDSLLHESHYILFQATDIISQDLTDQAKRFCEFNSMRMNEEKGGKGGKGNGRKGKGKGKRNDDDVDMNNQQSYFEPALQAMQHCCRLMDQVLPFIHHEKVVFYDRFAQLAVCAGQHDIARGAFSSAYQMSRIASGAEAPQTLQLAALVEDTPNSREEMVRRYAEN
jgi:hypothetical protein